MKHTFEIEVTAGATAKPAVAADMRRVIENVVYDAMEDLLEPEDLDVSVEEST